jgi:hypothetical protein
MRGSPRAAGRRPRREGAEKHGAATHPYLEGEVRARFDAWLAAAVARHEPPLRFREVRRGVQALSHLYVEGRVGSDLAARASEGRAKRAALATCFAPLHFLATRYAAEALDPAQLARVARIVDLGCGTGAAGAALAGACRERPRLLAIDRSGWALGEARHTYAAFGLHARTLRRRLPGGLPAARRGDLWLLGWMLNELAEAERQELLERLEQAQAAGAALLVLEPLAGRLVPWWPGVLRRFAPAGARAAEVKRRILRPERIAALDAASGLDHRVVGARLMFVPGADPQGS